MSDTLKSILLAAAVIIGFALIWAIAMPVQTKAWDGFGYWGGVLGVWAIASVLIAGGNYIADRRAKRNNTLPALALLLLAGGLYSCKPTETAKSEAKQEQQVAYEPRTETYTDAEGYDRTVNAEREW